MHSLRPTQSPGSFTCCPHPGAYVQGMGTSRPPVIGPGGPDCWLQTKCYGPPQLGEQMTTGPPLGLVHSAWLPAANLSRHKRQVTPSSLYHLLPTPLQEACGSLLQTEKCTKPNKCWRMRSLAGQGHEVMDSSYKNRFSWPPILIISSLSEKELSPCSVFY